MEAIYYIWKILIIICYFLVFIYLNDFLCQSQIHIFSTISVEINLLLSVRLCVLNEISDFFNNDLETSFCHLWLFSYESVLPKRNWLKFASIINSFFYLIRNKLLFTLAYIFKAYKCSHTFIFLSLQKSHLD